MYAPKLYPEKPSHRKLTFLTRLQSSISKLIHGTLPHWDKNTFLIIYKILHDALLLMLLSFMAMLVAEGLLPGIVSTHLSLARVAMVIVLILAAIIMIGNKFQITYPKPNIKRNKLFPILILFAFLLIGNSLLKFALWENMLITLTALLVFSLFYEIIFSSK